MSVQTSVIDKVQKLLAHAEGTSNAQEAENYYAKAQELMAKHSITKAMLASLGEDVQQDAVVITIDAPKRKKLNEARRQLANYLAKSNRSRCVVHPSEGKIYIIGMQRDVEFINVLFASLMVHMTARMIEEEIWQGIEGTGPCQVFRNNFAHAYATRIYERVQEVNKKVTQQIEQETGRSVALALRNTTSIVQGKVDERFPKLSTRRGSFGKSDASGRAAGRRAADEASLGRDSSLGGGTKGALPS